MEVSLTWKSPSDDANEYSNVMVVNWIREYNALYCDQIEPRTFRVTLTCT